MKEQVSPKAVENTERKGSKVEKVVLYHEMFLLDHAKVKYVDNDTISKIRDIFFKPNLRKSKEMVIIPTLDLFLVEMMELQI